MKERPILFQGEMVRAIHRSVNPKTQTRRALKVQPIDVLPMNDDKRGEEWDEEWKATHGYAMRTNILSENERLKAELDASLKTIQELQSAISQSRAQALEEAAERCRDIYSWPGAYTAGLLCERTTKACEAAIHALAQKEE